MVSGAASRPEGETLPELAARVGRAVPLILNRHTGRAQPVILVGHDSVNCSCYAWPSPLARYWRLRQEPCANALDFADDDFVVRLVNGTEHLTDANIGESPLTPTRQ